MLEYLSDRLVGSPFERQIRAAYRKVRRRSDRPADRRNREYDDLTIDAIRRVLHRDSNTVDAGAHRGHLLWHMIKAAPDGTHYAFEPLPRLAQRLRTRYPTAQVFELALGEAARKASFRYLPTSAAQSSLYARADVEQGQQVLEVPVQVRPLDDIWPEDLPLSFMKVDVEGAELELFAGAARTLARWKPVVVFECLPEVLPEAAAHLERAGLSSFLLHDLFDAPPRPQAAVFQQAMSDGEFYFGARPAG